MAAGAKETADLRRAVLMLTDALMTLVPALEVRAFPSDVVVTIKRRAVQVADLLAPEK